MDNVRTPSIARWKSGGLLPICRNWTFFAIFYSWDAISGNLSKSTCFERGWVTLSANFRRKGVSPPTTVGVRKLVRYQNIYSVLFGYLTKHACDCDRRTDRRTDRITTPKTALASLRRLVKMKIKWTRGPEQNSAEGRVEFLSLQRQCLRKHTNSMRYIVNFRQRNSK